MGIVVHIDFKTTERDKKMTKIINFILSKLPLVRTLNGHKTTIGVGMAVLSGIVYTLSLVLQVVPDLDSVVIAHQSLSEIAVQLASLLAKIGIPLAAVGAGHATIKARIDE